MSKVPFADLYQQYLLLKPEIDGAIESVIKDSAFIRGAHVDHFEEEFAKAIGVHTLCILCEWNGCLVHSDASPWRGFKVMR